jgi:hypothetical protein
MFRKTVMYGELHLQQQVCGHFAGSLARTWQASKTFLECSLPWKARRRFAPPDLALDLQGKGVRVIYAIPWVDLWA